jgi:hypothetical protein
VEVGVLGEVGRHADDLGAGPRELDQRIARNVDSVTNLLISSAPARRDTKLALLDYFRNFAAL